MNAITIDTLAIAKKLISGGYTQQQAETQAALWAEVVDEKLATKTDLDMTQSAIETDMRELEYRLTIKLGGMMVASIGAVTALVKIVH